MTLAFRTEHNIASVVICASQRCDGRKAAMLVVDATGAVVDVTTYGALAERIKRSAAGLRASGVGAGDRVLIVAPSDARYAVATLATLAVGAIAVPASPQLTEAELEWICDDAGASHAVCGDGRRVPVVRIPYEALVDADTDDVGVAPVAPETPALLTYTSGTGGRPKGVLHGHRLLTGRRPMRRGWTDIRSDDVILHAGQLNWSYAFGIAVLDTFSVGATSVVSAHPLEPAALADAVIETQATILAAVPSVYRRLLKHAPDRLLAASRSLRHALTAGESLTPDLHAAWTSVTVRPLYEALGMTECSTFVSSGPETPSRPGWVGRAQRGRTVEVLDPSGSPVRVGEVGRLAVDRRDPGLMLRYWNSPDEDARVFERHWFVGGDLVEKGPEGYLRYVGRADARMNAFGYRVSPEEVELVLAAVPGVRECAVAERAVGDGVTVICAYVVGEATDEEIVGACAATLAAYKRPRHLVRCASLPRNANGKVVRQALGDLGPGTRIDGLS